MDDIYKREKGQVNLVRILSEVGLAIHVPGIEEYVDELTCSIRMEVVWFVPVLQGGRITTDSYGKIMYITYLNFYNIEYRYSLILLCWQWVYQLQRWLEKPGMYCKRINVQLLTRTKREREREISSQTSMLHSAEEWL